jgi:hypothetical protein
MTHVMRGDEAAPREMGALVMRDLPVSLETDAVLQAQLGGRRRAPNPWLVEAAEKAVSLGHELAAPVAAVAEFAVQAVVGQQVVLAADPASEEGRTACLTVGPKADLLAPAQRLFVAVYSIGPALERRVHDLFAAGEGLLAFMLDSCGVVALGAVGEVLRVRTERRAADLGWGVSPALSPGSLVGWPVRGQRELCALLPLSEAGVRLNESCVLVPQKSVSMVMGLGPGYESAHVGSLCHDCCLKDHCWRRREDVT